MSSEMIHGLLAALYMDISPHYPHSTTHCTLWHCSPLSIFYTSIPFWMLQTNSSASLDKILLEIWISQKWSSPLVIIRGGQWAVARSGASGTVSTRCLICIDHLLEAATPLSSTNGLAHWVVCLLKAVFVLRPVVGLWNNSACWGITVDSRA